VNYEEIGRLSGMDIFERQHDEPGGFKFVIPHVMLSSDDVRVEFDRNDKVWLLTYEDAGRIWTGRDEDLTAAYLDLIADRCGLHEARERTTDDVS